MREADQSAAEQGQGAQVQGKAEAGMMLTGLQNAGLYFCHNFVRILSQNQTGLEALKNKAFPNFVLFVRFVPVIN